MCFFFNVYLFSSCKYAIWNWVDLFRDVCILQGSSFTALLFPRQNKKEEVEVGVSHRGVILYQEGEPIDSYGW